MVSIVEIAPPPAGQKVLVLGQEVEIFGITNRMWAVLARRYPEMKRRFASLEVPPEDLKISGMESAPAIIAAGLGKLGDDEVEAAVDRLPNEAQIALMKAIMELSYPPENPTPAATPTPPSETEASTISP